MQHFAGSTPYQYLPLPQSPILNYRTFTLNPASDLSDTIHGSLHNSSCQITDLEAPSFDEFEALSYAWGNVIPTSKIEFPNNSYLSIAANLESFLRYRRQPDQPVTLWIDAICINQDDVEERNSQVQAMGMIYFLASRLSIWLGPPSDDSALAMNALREFSYENPFAKLSSSLEQSAAIDYLLQRAWWFRAWVIQEVAFAVGTKYQKTTVRCGFECMTWMQLVTSCSRMHVNALNMRQRLPGVQYVLSLDALASRGKDELWGASEPYPCRLLRHLSEYRDCLASDPRDKIYSLIGLWMDAFDAGTKIGDRSNDKTHRPAPAVNYMHKVGEVYTEFASWILDTTQSLQLLHHCQPLFSSTSEVKAALPTWVPDWSQALVQARLPSTMRTNGALIPWWSLPVRGDDGGDRYLMDDQMSRIIRAEEVLRPYRSSLHYIPEWVADSLDPDGTKGSEAMLKELQSRPDFLFFFPDESDRALGNEEDVWTAVSRTQDHNERTLQKQVLSRCFQNSSLLRIQYRASGETACKARIKGKELHVNGILCDTVHEIFDVFPEEIGKDWTQSTRLMVQIGKCKHSVTKASIEKSPYISEQARLTAFWKTLFAGQQAKDETNIASWLPCTPHDWQWTAPVLTVLESGRLEYAEIQSMIKELTNHLAEMTSHDGNTLIHSASDEYLANNNTLLDARWTLSDRLQYQRAFEELGKQWTTQPYDLYHRPFNLPYAVPDPYWECRRTRDKVALKASIQTRHRTIIESLDAPDREYRRAARRFMADKIRQQPAREPQGIDDAILIKYALGRRLFVSKDGYLGLAPPDAQKGDRVAVLYGANVPFILRKTDSKFQVVGESYVHGLMDGEAVDMWRLGTKEVRNIVLI